MPPITILVNELFRSGDEIADDLLPDVEDAKKFVTNENPIVKKYLTDEDRSAELLEGPVDSDDYYTEVDLLGEEMTTESGTVPELLKDDNKMDEWVTSHTDVGLDPVPVWAVGTIGTLFRTLVLFFALYVLFSFYDAYTPSRGLLLLLGSLVVASFGYEIAKRVLSYGRPTLDADPEKLPNTQRLKRMVIANGVSMVLVSEAFLRAPQTSVEFLTELGMLTSLLLVVAIILGVLFGYALGLWGGLCVMLGPIALGAYLVSLSSAGPWFEWAMPNSGIAQTLDFFLGLAILASLAITILYGLTYPRRVWLNTYAREQPSGVLPGIWTAIVLTPILGMVWIRTQGGILPGQTGPTTFFIFLLLLLVTPSVAGSLLLLQSRILSFIGRSRRTSN